MKTRPSPDPTSWNRYTYALANPLTLADPNGRQSAEGMGLAMHDPRAAAALQYMEGQGLATIVGTSAVASVAVAGAATLGAPGAAGLERAGTVLVNIALNAGISASLSDSGERVKGGEIGGAVGLFTGLLPEGTAVAAGGSLIAELAASKATDGKSNWLKAGAAGLMSLITGGEVSTIGVGKYGSVILDNMNHFLGGLFFYNPPASTSQPRQSSQCGGQGFIGPCQQSTSAPPGGPAS